MWRSTGSAASAATSFARPASGARTSRSSRSTTSPTPSTLAHLLKYDSVHGTLQGRCRRPTRTACVVDGKQIASARRSAIPPTLPWKDLGVEVVLESTGFFTKRDAAAKHLEAGAQQGDHQRSRQGRARRHDRAWASTTTATMPASTRSSPTPRAPPTAWPRWPRCCTTAFGIEQGPHDHVHAYTNDQRILDLPHKDLRRARAAAVNIIPTSTGAAKAIGLGHPRAARASSTASRCGCRCPTARSPI